jgi:hypothetical protein
MDPLAALALSQSVRGIADTVRNLGGQESGKEKKTENKTEQTGGDFESFLKGIMSPDSANNTNEEDLFAAMIQERLKAHVGDDAAEAYATKLSEMKAKNTRSDGYVFVEKSAEEALSALKSEGLITAEQATKVKNDNKEQLFDGRGGPNDPTIAVMSMEAALIQARSMIEKIENGEVTAESGSDLKVTSGGSIASENIPNGTTFDGAEGFLFKPISENDKKLVVLLPAILTGDISKVLLKDKDGNEVESGRMTSVANGGREHFRFNKPGADYPKDLTVEVTMKDGSIKTYKIPDPSQRYD